MWRSLLGVVLSRVVDGRGKRETRAAAHPGSHGSESRSPAFQFRRIAVDNGGVSEPTVLRVPLTGSRSRARLAARIGHVLTALAGWVALAALWAWQLRLGVPSRWLDGPTVLLAVLVGWIGFLRCWVGWSRSIYRRRHRRITPLSLPVDFSQDSLGRKVTLEPHTVAAHKVEILVSRPGVKAYEPVETRSETEEVA